MKASICPLLGVVIAIGSVQLSSAGDTHEREQSAAQTSALTEQTREELLEARSTAWRAFFQNDPAVVERILAPELIAIQESAERWDTRTGLMKMAKLMNERGVRLARLEFPRTEIQLFGDTAILYYTYVMEQSDGRRSAVTAGRGTEIFVRRDGNWVDVGWHLDNGPFLRKDGQWIRVGAPAPEPSPASASRSQN